MKRLELKKLIKEQYSLIKENKYKKVIVYQTVDVEGKNMSNRALIFISNKNAFNFFKDPIKVLDALEIELFDDESIDTINYQNYGTNITFECEYAGKVEIVEMQGGKIIK